ncbi:MAG: transketolase, partial [Actinobacteria bacterium]|nr:transketolase [Actinomycetota bacterium]
MALFAIWRNKRGSPETERFEQELLAEVPYHPENVVAAGIQTTTGHFGLVAFSTTTRFLAAADQVALASDSACVLHGYA